MALPLAEAFTARSLGVMWNNYEKTLGSQPYLGRQKFGTRKQESLDLRFIKGKSGLPVSLKASNFDAQAELRDVGGFSDIQNEMPFYRESYMVTEREEQEYDNYRNAENASLANDVLREISKKPMMLIEARWLFGVDAGRIDVVIHPGSVVHSMVQFRDGAVKAQIGTPDMHLPIQYALTYPQRLPLEGRRLDFCELGTLEFRRPDTDRFPNLALAYECLRRGGCAGAVLNAANEVGVAAFLDGKIRFTDIARINEQTLSRMPQGRCSTLEQYRETDAAARETALSLI